MATTANSLLSHLIERYDAKDGENLVSKLENFKQHALKQSDGQILKICSFFKDGSDVLVKGGGLGKTQIINYFYIKNLLPIMPYPMIDFFLETTTFRILTEIYFNLCHQLNENETVLTSYRAFLQGLDANAQENVADNLSSQAVKRLGDDLKKDTFQQLIQSLKADKKQLVWLLFDAFEYMEQPHNINHQANYNYELRKIFIADETQGIFKILKDSGIALILSGRAVKAFEKTTFMTCHVGRLSRIELIDFIQKVKDDFYVYTERDLEQIAAITESRPIMVDIFFEVLRKQLKAHPLPKLIFDSSPANKKSIHTLLVEYDSNATKFEKDIFQYLHKKTATRNMATALYYMSIAHYGVTPKMIAYLFGHEMGSTHNVKIMDELSRWSYTKKPAAELAAELSTTMRQLADKAGFATADNAEYRLHDEMILMIHKHFWNETGEKEADHLLRKDFYEAILDFYEKEYAINQPNHNMHNENYRRRLREYYEYKLEMIHYLKERATMTDETMIEMAYHALFAMDKYPDHAKRLLEKTDNFFAKKYATNFFLQEAKIKIELLKIELNIDKQPENTLKETSERIQTAGLEKQTSVYNRNLANLSKAFARQAETFIHLGQLDMADNYLQQSARCAYESGDSICVAHTTHLRGFYIQRQAKFLAAMEWHTDSINTAILASLSLIRLIKQDNNVFHFEEKSQLKIAAKTIIRSIGNIAYNIRIRGGILSSTNYSKLLLYSHLNTHIGSEDVARVLIGLYRSYSFMGHELEKKLVLNQLKNIYFGYNTRLIRYYYLSQVMDWLKTSKLHYIQLFPAETFRTQFGKWATSTHEMVKKCKSLLIEAIFAPEFGSQDIDTITEDIVRQKGSKDIAEMFYLYGKTCLNTQLPTTQYPDFERAEKAFHNAQIAAEKAGFTYLAIEAAEALFTLSYLKTAYEPTAIQWQKVEMRHKAFLALIPNAPLSRNKDLHHDLLAKFYTTSGNITFEKASLQTHKLGLNHRTTLKQAFEQYAYMMYHAYQHNENRYNLSLQVVTERLQTLGAHHPTQLGYASGLFLDLLEERFKAQQLDFDESLAQFMEDYVEALLLCYSVRQTAIRKQPSEFVTVIYALNDKGRHHQAMLLSKLLFDYHHIKFEKASCDKKSKEYETLQEDLTLSYFHYAYCLQLNHHATEIEPLIQAGRAQLKKNKHFPLRKQQALIAILNIRAIVSLYRTQEFWNIERFIRGELTHFVKRFNANHEKSMATLVAEMGESLLILVQFCLTQTDLNQKPYRYLRLLAESCFRLGELCLLSEENYDNPHTPQGNQVLNESLNMLYQQWLQDSAFFKQDAWEDSEEQIKIHQQLLGNYSGAVYLSYAYQFCKWIQDAHGAAQNLETIANLYYFKDKFEKKRTNIPPTVKYYCLTQATKSKYQEKTLNGQISHPQANRTLITAFLKETDFEYPLVMAQMKIVEGDAIFSQIFEIEEASYSEMDGMLQPKENLQPNNRLILERYLVRKEYMETYPLAAMDRKYHIHIMFLNYLKALNLLAIVPYPSFMYNNMVSEIIRRVLLIPDDSFLEIIEQDLSAIWLSFDNLRRRRETLEELLLTTKVHRVSLLMKNIFNPEKAIYGL